MSVVCELPFCVKIIHDIQSYNIIIAIIDLFEVVMFDVCYQVGKYVDNLNFEWQKCHNYMIFMS